MSAYELLNDMKRLQKSLNNKRVKRRNESIDDYIKRKANYRCSYCHKTFNKKQLNSVLEPYHILKPGETLKNVLDYYRINKEELLTLNPELKLADIQTGTLMRVPDYFKIFPKTHGVCYCDKCGEKRKQVGMDHISFIHQLLKERRLVREVITPELRRKIFKRDLYKCVYCEIEFGQTKPHTNLTLDHKTPVVQGGTSSEENLCSSCDYHNRDKDRASYESYEMKIRKRKFYRENGMIR
ncbi:HNH endonuclease [[Brevibacterium] frigoritolerans]|nr:HNH endonuclease [Peribacillus frigoritolerans]